MKLREKWKSGIAILMCLALIVPMIPQFRINTEAASSRDPYGFDPSVPDSFKETQNDGENPHGDGIFTLNPKSELFVWRQNEKNVRADSYNYNNNNDLRAKDIADDSYKATTTVGNSRAEYYYVSTEAYDPNNTGHDDMVAMVGVDSLDGEN